MRKTKKKYCIFCNSEFQANISELNRGNGKFCSVSCASKQRWKLKPKSEPNCKCAYCGKHFYKSKSKIKASKSGLFFCCRKHKDASRKILSIEKIMMPKEQWSKKARTLAFKIFDPQCNRCKYNKCKGILEVHHKNRNTKDNSKENLEVLCPTCHQEEHFDNDDGRYRKLLN